MSDSRPRSPKLLTGVIVAGFALLVGVFTWRHLDTTQSQDTQAAVDAFRGTGRPPLAWKTASKAERKAAATTISGQLEAFKHNQWSKAVAFQSSALKQNFPSTDQFRQVIQSAYPQFANYRSVSYGNARSSGDLLQMEIVLVGTDSVTVHALYTLQKEAGLYRVQGVAGGVAPGRRMVPARPQDLGLLPA